MDGIMWLSCLNECKCLALSIKAHCLQLLLGFAFIALFIAVIHFLLSLNVKITFKKNARKFAAAK